MLGKLAAESFISQNPGWFSSVDIIIPVPLHKKRLRQRTYNQSELIAEGISRVTHIPLDTSHLLRIIDNPTQTQRTPEERRLNTQGIFSLSNPNSLSGKHVLLVDDIVTTGATLRSCCSVLTPVRNLHISIFTLGTAGKY